MINDIYSYLTVFSRSGSKLSLPLTSTVMALGTFDGVHIAHRALINETRALKERLGAALLGVWCFEKSPAAIIRGEEANTLTDREEKLSLLFECGADVVIMASFEHFRDMSADDFINDILIKGLGALGTVCGYDHRFGHRGLGTPALLADTFGKDRSVTIPEIMLDGETVSSSAIRAYLKSGEIETASAMLGRPLSFSAEVKSGKRLGRTLGFPTANQALPRSLSYLKHGVYATLCYAEDNSYIGISNVGVRPSISEMDDHSLNCETYLIGFEGELYGKSLTLEFCSFLREEMRFSSLGELCEAIKHDKEKALAFFRRMPR